MIGLTMKPVSGGKISLIKHVSSIWFNVKLKALFLFNQKCKRSKRQALESQKIDNFSSYSKV